MARIRNTFQTIHSEGGLLPPDLLRRILDSNDKIPGTRPEDYGLPRGERINETITQSWNRLCRHWAEFRDAAQNMPEGEPGTGLTNEKWNVPFLRELGFGMLPTSPGPEINGRTYAINRFFGPVAIHLIGCGLSLDRRAAGVRGAALANPHGLVQEFLNRCDGFLWAILSNGLRFRILRDNQSLSRQSYLEFDLETMFSGQVFPDFVLLWLMGHATRLAPLEEGRPESCWLERWVKLGAEQGARLLGDLRTGVEKALAILGQGFVGHQRNTALRESLRTGRLSLKDFHGQLLRLVYRLIFLFVAEDRTLEGASLLHARDHSEKGVQARERYSFHYGTARLRELASQIKGSRHSDLWYQFNLLVGALSGDESFATAREHLALPALGSFLWSIDSTAALNAPNLSGAEGSQLANIDFLESIRHLAFTSQEKVLRPVDYKHLGSEELGGIYESLLALTPQISGDGIRFTFAEFAGNERKTSGSYYTPDSLVQCLLDSALDPVVQGAIKGKTAAEAERAILSLKVCDPAVGSGHFLVRAAHRLSKYLARMRALVQGESEPSPPLYQGALRDVISRCLYGVDINPMATELCKVSLWMEAMQPGKPLAFLDHHIKCGNSLLGTTPALIKKGIPDDAFKPLEGDDKDFCKEYRKKNRDERRGKRSFFAPDGEAWEQQIDLSSAMLEIDACGDSTMDGLHCKEVAYSRFVSSNDYILEKLINNAWCAAFVWEKRKSNELPYPITQEIFDRVKRSPHRSPPWMQKEIIRLSEEYRFFHWHLEFPDVFSPKLRTGIADDEVTGWSGGFDCVLGNPPWERIKLQEKEFFASRNPGIANAPNAAARRRMIANLPDIDPALHQAFRDALRQADGESRLVRGTGRYPLCGRGDVNTYSIFAELKRSLLSRNGRVGCIVPSGIATDDTTKHFFQSLMDKGSLVSLYSFENEDFIFPAIHHATKFCLLTMAAPESAIQRPVDFVFFARHVEHLAERERHFTLTADDIALLNPNTRTCPIFRSKQDSELTKYIYKRLPVLVREPRDGKPEENPWRIKFATMFHMANDSVLFRTMEQMDTEGFMLSGNVFKRGEDVYLPLYEGKMFWHFDHRFGTYQGQTEAQANQGKLPELSQEQHADPDFLSQPRYWVSEENVKARLPKRPQILASALETPEQLRNVAVIKTFCYWAAGYWRTIGDEQKAKRLLASVSRLSQSDTQMDALNNWLLDEQCERMQERYPLTYADVKRMTAFTDDPIPLAEELIDRFSPRWFVAFRDVTSAVVLRTAVFSILPYVGVGHTAPIVFFDKTQAQDACAFLGCMNSLALDYCARQSVGGSHLTYSYLRQFPILTPANLNSPALWDIQHTILEWLSKRVLELVFTAWDNEEFSCDIANSFPPFCFSDERRFIIRSELDAALFCLYLGDEKNWNERGSKELLAYFPTPRHAIEYILDTFRILRERDEATYGTYRTKNTILEIYDEMAHVMADNAMAVAAGQQPFARYHSRLNPPPGPPCDAQGTFMLMAQWDRANWPSHIHLPREEAISQPEEFSLEEFAAMIYPATDSDRAICAAALSLVEQTGGLSSMEHLDGLLLSTHPDWCKVFLDDEDQRGLHTTIRKAPKALFVSQEQSIRWKECRDYLEQQRAISVRHGDKVQTIHLEAGFTSVKSRLPDGVDAIMGYAIKAMKRIMELRKNLDAVPQDQLRVINAFEEQHRLYQLAA